jgi:uncharacterized protein YbaP (TraB family)
MKKISILLFFVLGIFSCQKNITTQSKPEIKEGLLWEISKKGTKTSYLYGTMHTSNKRVISMSSMADTQLDKCEVMAGELLLGESDLMAMVGLMFMQDSTLEMLLPENKYRVVRKKLVEELGAMAALLEKVKPMFLVVMIEEQRNNKPSQDEKDSPMAMFGNGSKEPLDLYLQSKAKKKGKEVIGLETVEEQMSAFNTVSLKEQAEMLYQSLTNTNSDSEIEKGKTSMEKMLDLYYEQKIDSLYFITTQSLSSVSNKKLLGERNATMATRMEKIMQNKSLFAAVGAAHLAGDEGLIELLRKKGYKVRSMKKM